MPSWSKTGNIKGPIDPPQRAIITVPAGSTNGRVTWTYPTAFSSGVVPIIEATPVKPTSSTATFNAQIYGDPTNTSCTIEVNAVASSGTLAVLGALLTIFTPAAAGTKVHVTARAP